jgi:aminoglycoside phosphotransferase (APT) family kinase protein
VGPPTAVVPWSIATAPATSPAAKSPKSLPLNVRRPYAGGGDTATAPRLRSLAVPMWEAEATVDEVLVRRLLAQFRELEIDSLRPVAEGWDRAIWLVNEEWAFGFPRRTMVIPGLERELEWLPRLAPLLPLPIPVPELIGRPEHGFPWPFFGSRFLPGVEVAESGLDELGRLAAAVDLAAFLHRLHSDDVARSVGADALPLDGNARANMQTRVPLTRRALAEVEQAGLWRAPPAVARLLDDAEKLPGSSEPFVVAHGDLHFRHLLVEDGHASGVIDWIDLCRADAAIDLQLVWSFLPAPDRGAFLGAYGRVTEEQLVRARVIALSLCCALASYAHAENLPSIEREALAGLDRAATE